MAAVSWPGGFSDFYYKVRLHAGSIVSGTVIAMDPASGSSSMPGFAVFRDGELVESGTLLISKKLPIQKRLQAIYEQVQGLTPISPDVFTIELIRGRQVHNYLQWSIGTAVAASRAPVMLELPILVWKRYALQKPGYVKGDEADAICMGESLILLAKESLPK